MSNRYQLLSRYFALFCFTLLLSLVMSVNADEAPLPLPANADATRALEIWTQQAKLTAADGASNNFFGYSVSLSGDTVLVGAYIDGSGSAYVFVNDGIGNWTQQAKLIADDGAMNDRFGYSVSLSGDTALVGAPNDDSYRGSAYVFVNDGAGNWKQQAKLTAGADAAAGDYFGYSVSLSGDTALVGAYSDDSSIGSAYVFVNDGAGNWTQQAKLTADDGASGDQFGISVSLSGDTALVGAYVDAPGGSAYVFVNDGAGNWTQQAKLTAADGVANGYFGRSVSLDGDTALVGADGDDGSRGSAYVFVNDGAGNWTQQTKLTADDRATGALFGRSVSLSGDTALVGVPNDDSYRGSAYVFVNDGMGNWTLKSKLIAADGVYGDRFGTSVSLSGDMALVGASNDDANGGSVYAITYDPTLYVELSSVLVTVEESDSGSVTSGLGLMVRGDAPTLVDHTVTLNLSDGTATLADNDYSQTTATITIPAGDYTTPVTLPIDTTALAIIGDTTVETDELFFVDLVFDDDYVSLGDANEDAITRADAMLIIVNDDEVVSGPEPDSGSLSIADVIQAEGDAGTVNFSFSVVLDNTLASGFTVNYATNDATATTSDGDYASASGTLTFAGAAGEIQTFTVSVNGDTTVEDDETFTVTLSNPSSSNVTVSDTATGTILNDDSLTETLTDGGFEGTEKVQGAPIAWSPKGTNIVGKDKQKCDIPEKNKYFANSGNCAFMFKGNPTGEKSKINQKVTDLSAFTNGAGVTFSVYVDKRSATANHPIGKLIVGYDNGDKDKVILRIPNASGYTLVSDNSITIDLSGRVLNLVKVQFRNKLTSGKFFIDDASLTVSPATTLRLERELLPLPEAPGSFRD